MWPFRIQFSLYYVCSVIIVSMLKQISFFLFLVIVLPFLVRIDSGQGFNGKSVGQLLTMTLYIIIYVCMWSSSVNKVADKDFSRDCYRRVLSYRLLKITGWHVEENFQCAQTLMWTFEFSWLMVKWFVWFRVVKWWVTFSAATEVSPWTMLGISTQLCLCWLSVRSAGSVSVFSHWR